jgi:hypothetical protein
MRVDGHPSLLLERWASPREGECMLDTRRTPVYAQEEEWPIPELFRDFPSFLEWSLSACLRDTLLCPSPAV